jgi:hypothetical protein
MSIPVISKEYSMKKALGVAIVLGIIGGGAAFAQNVTTSTSVNPLAGSTNTASKTATARVAGANSFTESEARNRLEAHGYTNVTGLKKDDKSIWRGQAVKDGTAVNVALDYQGNIVVQ